SRKENGCLRVLPGSHKLGQLDHETTSSEANMLFFGQTAKIVLDASDDTRWMAVLLGPDPEAVPEKPADHDGA
ncbi:MAG: phytanoyl-CoA dioxygenase family protein, partial [Gammaproteobacteria bacterium]